MVLHPCRTVRGCGLLWVILGKNGISFSRKLGRGFSASITLGFFQQNTFWIKAWFVKHRKHHEWCDIKPGICSVYVSTTVQLRMAKCSAWETVRLPQPCRNTAGVEGSLCFPPVGAGTSQAENTWKHPHLFLCVGWRYLWRGRFLGCFWPLRWVRGHATQEQTFWGTVFLLFLEILKITNENQKTFLFSQKFLPVNIGLQMFIIKFCLWVDLFSQRITTTLTPFLCAFFSSLWFIPSLLSLIIPLNSSF